jgi:tRNA(Ile)-lysidine synthase
MRRARYDGGSMPDSAIRPIDPVTAAQAVPAGAWAVAVSGGADSVALLELLRHRSDLSLHVVHLDHETRAGESAADAAFVRQLATRCGVPCTIALRSQVETGASELPGNLSSRYRVARLKLFRRVVADEKLDGVIVAHHVGDQAETILLRLLRGSGPAGLTGMAPRTVIGGLTILRPLLSVRGEALRALLRERGIAWRDDASNQSPLQKRNRIRALLLRYPALAESLVELGRAAGGLMEWLHAQGPELADTFEVSEVANLPSLIAREALRRWLTRLAGPGVDVPASATQRLAEMASDLATPPRQHFPGGLLVRRRGGRIFVDSGVRADRVE